ncbi:peptidoglycan-binding protein [Thioclava litoralis]
MVMTCLGVGLASGFGLGAGQAMAQDAPAEIWDALVVDLTQNGAGLPQSAAKALTTAGATRTTVARAPDQTAIATALGQAHQAGRGMVVAVYGDMAQSGARLTESALRNLIIQSGLSQTVLLSGNCAQASGAPAAPRTLPRSDRIRLIASAAPGETCPDGGDRLFARLQQAGDLASAQPVSAYFAGFWSDAANDAPDLMLTPVAQTAPATVQISAPAPEDSSAAPLPAAFRYAPPQGADLTQVPDETLAAIPTAKGLPQPSVILGLIGPAFLTPTPEDGTQARDLASRIALRQDNPETYRALVNEGAFDPPAAQMARAIQTELARMGCYRQSIDGKWGAGSRAAVRGYFNERDDTSEAVTEDAAAALYRQIILAPDVACPAPKTVVREETPRTSPVRQTPQRTAPPPAAPKEDTPVIKKLRLMNGVYK